MIAAETFKLLSAHIAAHQPFLGMPRNVSETDLASQFLQLDNVDRDNAGDITAITVSLVDHTHEAVYTGAAVVQVSWENTDEGVLTTYSRRNVDGTISSKTVSPDDENHDVQETKAARKMYTFASRFANPTRRGDPREI